MIALATFGVLLVTQRAGAQQTVGGVNTLLALVLHISRL